MNNEQQNPKKWYDNKVLVVLLCVIFFPVGLYGLWKNSEFSKSIKIGLTGIVAVFFLMTINNDGTKDKIGGGMNENHNAPSEERAAGKPEIEILQSTPKSDGYANYVHVRVRNNTNKLCTYADLSVTYFDKAGNIVGTGMGNTSNLAAGAERTIDCIAMNIEGADKYEVQVGNVMW